jgi:thioredoxin-like negative regulator of GroEL
MRRKVVFAPGSLDSFEGTQQELDSLVDQLVETLQDSAFENHVAAWNLDELAEIDPDIAEAVLSNPTKRTLH